MEEEKIIGLILMLFIGTVVVYSITKIFISTLNGIKISRKEKRFLKKLKEAKMSKKELKIHTFDENGVPSLFETDGEYQFLR